MNGRPELMALLRGIVLEVAEKPIPEVTGDMQIAELGLDSISVAEIVVRLEDRLGVEIPATQWLRARTLQDIIDIIEQADHT
jgi:acyl carrier protein